MNCEEVLVLISGYLDDRNTEEEMTQLRAHLEQCPACRQFLEAFQEIDRGTAALEAEPPADFKDMVMASVRAEAKPVRKRNRWIPVAIAAAFVAVIGLGAVRQDTNVAETMPMVATADQAVQVLKSRTVETDAAAAPDAQKLADRFGSDVVVTKELLPEMEVCSCETLEDGSLLYVLETADMAQILADKYGLELVWPMTEGSSEVSYAWLIS